MLKPIRSLFLSSLLVALFAGCATAGYQQSGKDADIHTSADKVLRGDIMQMIIMRERATGRKSCPSLVSASISSRTEKMNVERWTVESDGIITTYLVTISPDPQGGAYFSVINLKE